MTSPAQASPSGSDSASDAVSPRAWRALAVGAAGYVLFGFNATATNLAFGSIADDFSGVSESLVSWISSGFFIASAAFLPLGGRLGDRLGRRRMFNLGLFWFAVFAVLSAVAPSIWVLILGRVGQATAAAAVIPASLSMVLSEFPERRRSSAVATWAAAGPLSAAIAPSTAAILLQVSSWRWVYALSAPPALLIIALSFRWVPVGSLEPAEGKLDLPGTALATTSIGLLILSISQGPSWGWIEIRTVGAAVAALLLGASFLVRSSRHPTPLLNLGLFRYPEVSLANLANLLMSVTSLSIWLVWPLWLGRVWGYSTSRIGLAITIGPICAGLATLVGGRVADRYGQRWLMIFGSALATAAVLWSVFRFDTNPDYLRQFVPTIAGFGTGWGLSNPSMNSWALTRVPPAVYGEVNAAFNTIRNLGGAIGVSAVIAMIGAADRPDVLAAYDRANLFLAVSIGLSCATVTIGPAVVSMRSRAGR